MRASGLLFRLFLLASVTMGLSSCAGSPGKCASASPDTPSLLPPAVTTAAMVITPELLRTRIAKLASDEFAGRGPATEGDRAARAYLAAELAALGVEPGRGRDGWEQDVDLVGVKAAMPASWTFERGGQHIALAWWDQYIAASGVQTNQGNVDRAEVVFVGYGIQAPEYGWDDFKGRDVRGKVLLMMNNDPDWDPSLFAGTTRLFYGRWTY